MSLLLLFPDLGVPLSKGKVYIRYLNNRIEYYENDTLVFTMEA